MKNLSQFPRKISAKFCYGVENFDHFDDAEAVDLQDNTEQIKLQETKTKILTKAEIEAAKEADRNELEKAKKALEELPGNEENNIARQDFASEDPYEKIPDLNNVMNEVTDVLRGAEELAKNLGGYPQFEDAA